MDMHNLQIVLMSSNMVNRYQSLYQHQAAQAQLQDVMRLNEESNERMHRPREVEEEASSKEIGGNEGRSREWKKEPENEEKRKDVNMGKKIREDEIRSRLARGADHIIDIRA